MLVSAQRDLLVQRTCEAKMPKPNEKLAESLIVLRALQTNGRRVFRSKELTRTHRESFYGTDFSGRSSKAG